MGISASIVMIAVGAILAFALPGTVLGVNMGVIGTILMVVGALGLVVSLVVWGPWGRGAVPPGEDDVVEERRVYGRRRPF